LLLHFVAIILSDYDCVEVQIWIKIRTR
jgi:hypothetical protein